MVGARHLRRRHTARWLPAVLVLACALGSCDDGTRGGGGDEESPEAAAARRQLLSSVAERVVLPAVRDFADAAAALRDATEAYAVAAQSGTAQPQLDAARAAFATAMGLWQALEVMELGPAGSAEMVMGGEDLRDEIYSWATVSACRVDQEVVADAFSDNGFFAATLVNAYGLDALEYLLHAPGEGNDCPQPLAINAQGQWAALSADDIRTRRGDYAAAVASEIARRAEQLRDAWEPEGGNFAAELGEAGQRGVYGSTREALDALLAAMFYVDLKVKDRKLAHPAGLSPDCAADTCPEARESRWANLSKDNVVANLHALRAVYTGGPPDDDDAYGFDTLLVSMGADTLAEELTAEIHAAIEATEAIDGTLVEALAADPTSVRDAHEAVKRITDLLKSQFVTVLNLAVPQEGAGDND